MESFSAVLLAAGRSTRMGCDKALIEVSGIPLWSRQRDVLADAGAAEIFLSARPEQRWAHAAPGFAAVVADAGPDGGPIMGIIAALERAAYARLAVLAVDLPRIEADWFRRLGAQVSPGVGLVGRRGDAFEPLAAFYPRAILPLARAAVARGERSLQRLLEAAEAGGLMRVCPIGEHEAAWFENWNEPADTGPRPA